MEVLDRFRREVRKALDGRPPVSAAVAAGLPRNAIRQILLGHEPKLGRAAAVASALGLEFYFGPPRQMRQGGSRDDQEILRLLLSIRAGLEHRDLTTQRQLRRLRQLLVDA